MLIESLHKRLIALLAAFAAFAVLSAVATIYGVHHQVSDAADAFERSISRGRELEQLRVAAREQAVLLREIVADRRTPDESHSAARDEFFLQLDDLVRFSPEQSASANWQEVGRLSEKLKQRAQECLALVEAGQSGDALRLLETELEGDWIALDTRLRSALAAMEAARERSVKRLLSTQTGLLLLAVLIGVCGAGLVAIGAMLIRRWLISPIALLRQATEEFRRGNLGFRVKLSSRDELGALADLLNRMAETLVASQSKLHVSESKYRALFENLQDAVLICDAQGRIVEYHDSATGLLQPLNQDVRGHDLADWWLRWLPAGPNWGTLVERVLGNAQSMRAADRPFSPQAQANLEPAPRWVDLVSYPVEFGSRRYLAVVLRDTTERHTLEAQARRSEAMQATVAFAQGIAHDFNNLLTSAISSLSQLQSPVQDAPGAPTFAAALRSCTQAAGLARRLLDFAGYDQGRAQWLALGEMVEQILASLDQPFLEGVQVRTHCDDRVKVYMDRDQLTQVILNLVRNAREAMPTGGELHIRVEANASNDSPSQSVQRNRRAQPTDAPRDQGPMLTVASARRGHPDSEAVEFNSASSTFDGSGDELLRGYAALIVEDTGCGMSEEVKEKLFEPFFSTKGGKSPRRRGMGLAVVYAAVNHAGARIDVESRIGAGTRFRVLLPAEIAVAVSRRPVVPSSSVPESDH
jgi:signal transduction histidine kinase/HAMP domain-containing protein